MYSNLEFLVWTQLKLFIWKYQYQLLFWTYQIRCSKYLLLLQQNLLLTGCTARGRNIWSKKTTWPRALLCCVREVMFFKRSLNISEFILIYFKYFYGMGYFLFKEKWTTMLQQWRKWRWASAYVREWLYECCMKEK